MGRSPSRNTLRARCTAGTPVSYPSVISVAIPSRSRSGARLSLGGAGVAPRAARAISNVPIWLVRWPSKAADRASR